MSCHASLALLSTWILTLASGGAQQGTITGTVLDAGDKPVSGAIVVLCDHVTGVPVSRETYQPFVRSGDHQSIAFATTEANGSFTFPDVPPGSYRLVAQSWPVSREPVQQLLEVNGRIVQLHGVVPRIDVPSDAAKQIAVRPLGTSSLDIITAPQAPNDETLVLISSKSLAADPILGFAAWSGPFMEQLLGGNRMPRGRTVFRGLPAGKLHVAAFAADNNPGFGGICCETRPEQTTFVSLPLIASWSDGHKQPPAELETLVKQFREPGAPSLMEILRAGAPAAAATIETSRRETRDPWSVWIPVLNVQVEMRNGNTVLVKDLVAANSYAELLQHDEDRKRRSRQKPPE